MLECSLASDLECSYSYDKFGYYTCMTMNLKLEKVNALIESVKGQHMPGKEQIDVNGMMAVRSNNKYFSSDIFKKFPSLKVLSLMYYSVESIEQGNFEGAHNLEYIYIHNNDLGELTDNIFSGASKLVRLEMKSNSIISLSNETFAGLTSLEFLNLDHNQLKSLPMGIFDDLINLKQISLEGNILENVNGDLFKYNLKLTQLSLSNNHLSVIGSNLLTNLNDLESAHFYHNPCISTSLFESEFVSVLVEKIAKCTESNKPEQRLIKAQNQERKTMKLNLEMNRESEELNKKLTKCENHSQKSNFAYKCFH